MRKASRDQVAASVRSAPVFGVVRTDSYDAAEGQARAFMEAGLELIEITFSVPNATSLVSALLDEADASGPPWIGMGTVTTQERARAALSCGAEFIVSPNISDGVARLARDADRYLLMGGLTATEIVHAWELGADMVKVYPLGPVGGASYLSVVRQPLAEIPMLAGGGFGLDEIEEYAEAGARAFGIGPPMVGPTYEETVRLARRALELARRATGASS
ncbi:MAG: 2-dehydro-3-deoxyphosphogluconate aldolase [Acidobacteriota bacterium]